MSSRASSIHVSDPTKSLVFQLTVNLGDQSYAKADDLVVSSGEVVSKRWERCCTSTGAKI